MTKKLLQALIPILLVTSCKDPEDCSDNIDNDGDGGIDCQDSDCSADDGCQAALCGDGVIDGAELCDGDNLNGRTCADLGFSLGALSCNDECSLDASGCSNPTCGDSIVSAPEACDDGNSSNTDDCLDSCQLASCGDGFIQSGVEVCDDGNNNNGDGCDAQCRVESCGDGVVQAPETCDDGGTTDEDGCSSLCAQEVPCAPEDFPLGNNFIHDPATGHCYVQLLDGQSWQDAQDTCELLGGYLAVIESSQESDVIASLTFFETWIGFQDIEIEGDIQRVNGGSLGAGFQRFAPGEPNNVNDEDCMNLRSDSLWNDSDCAEDNVVLCEIELNHCGDGVAQLFKGEDCDDGDLNSGDGCSSDCQVESQFSCVGDHSICAPSSCGDGVLDAGEGCDDSNNIDGDGCSFACVAESLCAGLTVLGFESTLLDPLTGRCYASGTLDATWQQAEGICEGVGGYLVVLDSLQENQLVRAMGGSQPSAWIGYNDIATEAGEGSALFQRVTGGAIGGGFSAFTLFEMDNTPEDDCAHYLEGENAWGAEPCDNTLPQFICELEPNPCGDGILQPNVGEACDDGDALSDDGCSAQCQVERCGDGITQANEECDDANSFAGDGCAGCVTELCGDGLINLEETCDDANTTNNDGCDDSCQTEACAHDLCTIGGPLNELCDPCLVNLCNFEPGCCNDAWDETCAELSSFFCGADCDTTCGNGALDAGEACDDGNSNFFDGCSGECTPELCGDGVINVIGEECDDGNTDPGDGCAPLCKREVTCNAAAFPGADNFVNDPDSGHCLAHFTQTISWQQAEANCEGLGGYLNVVDSALENLATKSITTPGTNTWIGFNDIAAEAGTVAANFQKVTGGTIGAGFHSFATNQPNGVNGPDCVVMQGGNDDWNDLSCGNTSVTQYVCEFEFSRCGDGVTQSSLGETCDDDNRLDGDGCDFDCQLELCGDGITNNTTEECDDGNNIDGDGCESDCSLICGDGLAFAVAAVIDNNNGHCLVFSKDFLTWNNAELACEEQGGYLAVADDAQEEALLQSIKRENRAWIGFTDQPDEAFNNPDGFTKVTGDAASFLNFSANEPNQANGGLNEDCVQDVGSSVWNDTICNIRDTGLFCEIEPAPCGDGVIQSSRGEACDDGNTANGDGCSSTCAIEAGFSCTSTTPAIGRPSVCQ